ncbi:MAG: hypothetical protein LBL66_00090 [Clostridiales bacterium]|nr:hypothetical protein [Clostridiales bacterium]
MFVSALNWANTLYDNRTLFFAVYLAMAAIVSAAYLIGYRIRLKRGIRPDIEAQKKAGRPDRNVGGKEGL